MAPPSTGSSRYPYTHYDARHKRSVALRHRWILQPLGGRLPRTRVAAMVNLTRIYTRTGDGGETRLGDMSVTTKNDPGCTPTPTSTRRTRSSAWSWLRRPRGGRPRRPDTRAERPLRRRRRPLHARRAGSRVPAAADRAGLRRPPRGLVRPLQRRPPERCGRSSSTAAPPAPPTCTSRRTVVRRAERAAWAAYDEHGEAMNQLAITYLNRLSDLLFILARYANREQGDVLWVPGGERGDAATEGRRVSDDEEGRRRDQGRAEGARRRPGHQPPHAAHHGRRDHLHRAHRPDRAARGGGQGRTSSRAGRPARSCRSRRTRSTTPT